MIIPNSNIVSNDYKKIKNNATSLSKSSALEKSILKKYTLTNRFKLKKSLTLSFSLLIGSSLSFSTSADNQSHNYQNDRLDHLSSPETLVISHNKTIKVIPDIPKFEINVPVTSEPTYSNQSGATNTGFKVDHSRLTPLVPITTYPNFATANNTLRNGKLVDTSRLTPLTPVTTYPNHLLQSKPIYQNQSAIFSADAIHHPLWAQNGMVATQEAVASEIGLQILKDGGNAVDAAVAVGFTLAVTLPRAGNIGGGGFMMIYDANTQKTIALDYREKAPINAYRDMYLDDEGNADSTLSRFHGLAVGVPGTVAGLVNALENHGTMSLSQVMAPAIKLAEEGMVVTPSLAESLKSLEDRLKKWPSTSKIFYKADGSYYEAGEKLRQPELAESLRLIAEQGTDGFYSGKTANEIVMAVNQAGGLMSIEDFESYNAVEREPVWGNYRGYSIASMPPPSSGGAHIIQILNILEGYPLNDYGHNSAQTIHLMSEAMQLAYADRSEYLGDADFVEVPLSGLTSKAYAQQLRASIDPNNATPASLIKPNNPIPYESDETTHFSIVDKWGNAVANTYTLNFSYGTGLVAEGTGILLNNEMDDFSAKPGVPNAYGLLGNEANAVQARKRPLSSMSPTIVFKDDKPYIVTGSPGGSRIITTVTQVISNVIDHDMNIAEATHATRIHDQWNPDEIRIEKSLNVDTISKLESMGHTVTPKATMGSTQSIMLTPEGMYGSSDPRRADSAVVGY